MDYRQRFDDYFSWWRHSFSVAAAESLWLFFIIMGVLGIGYGLSVTTTTVEAQASVPKEEIGVATSFNTLSRTIGQTVMVSLLASF